MLDYTDDQEIKASRSNDLAIHPIIFERWSPRALLSKPISEEDLLAVIDAAHWAPSCFNEQPWRFVVAHKPEDLHRLQTCLAEENRVWADQAPVLIVVLSSPVFQDNRQPNRWHAFDSGTAWGYLALEAHHRGLVAHAMGGFSEEKVRELLKVPLDWGVHAVVALGYRGPTKRLPKELQAREYPTTRCSLNEIWSEGVFRF